jgi:membrane-associated protein
VESGLLVGLVLPGDSLLFTAGFLASQGYLDLPTLIVISFACAVLGDNLGYYLGKRYGPKIFRQEEGRLFGHQQLERAERFFERHGGKTVMLARFMPVVRSFAPMLAGIGRMRYRVFMAYNLAGGVLWAIGLPVAGYYLGRAIPSADRYLLPIVLVIVLASVSPTMYHLARDKRARGALFDELRRYIFR